MKRLLILLPLTVFLPSCSPLNDNSSGPSYLSAFRNEVPDGKKLLEHERGYWDGDNVQGAPMIRIKRDEQKAYFYKGPELVGVSPIATGKTTHTTPAGSFKISQKNKDHKSSLYGVIRNRATGQIVNDDADTRKHRPGPGEFFEAAPMPYFMRFNGGVGMHVGHLPGYAASHGCVRMPEPMAIKFFQNIEIGTPVIVE
ncbi:L,D-transpeptidase family protein [Verrucomicrobiaceae bacterium 227]